MRRCREAATYVADKLCWSKVSCYENGEVLPKETVTARLRAAVFV